MLPYIPLAFSTPDPLAGKTCWSTHPTTPKLPYHDALSRAGLAFTGCKFLSPCVEASPLAKSVQVHLISCLVSQAGFQVSRIDRLCCSIHALLATAHTLFSRVNSVKLLRTSCPPACSAKAPIFPGTGRWELKQQGSINCLMRGTCVVEFNSTGPLNVCALSALKLN